MSNITKAIAALGVVAGLGVASLPLSSYAAPVTKDSDPVKVLATIDKSLSVAATSSEVNFGTIIAGGAVQTQDLNVEVSTNVQDGYTLEIKSAGTDAALHTVDATGSIITSENGNNHVGQIGAGVPEKGKSAWGYRLNNTGEWKAVTTSGAEVGSSDGASSEALETETFTVTFGISASATQADGTYQGSVIFTATQGE